MPPGPLPWPIVGNVLQLKYLPAWLYGIPAELKKFSKVANIYWGDLLAEGAEAPEQNFSKVLLKSKEEQGLSESDITELVALLIGGGVDTTSSTLHTLVLGLCAFPDAQRKAHEELDRVVGRDRSPTWDDIDQLPYCAAILKETMRWRSAAVVGVGSHALTIDDENRGYRFQVGIQILGNLSAIHGNPKDFPEPDVFNPDRFFQESRLPYPNSRGHNAFGWVCSYQPFESEPFTRH